MKIRFLVTIVLMVGGLSLVRAQEAEAVYILREVGAEEYLEAIPSILDQFINDVGDQNQYEYGVMFRIVTRELVMKYPDLSTVPYKILKLADAYIARNMYSGAEGSEQKWQNWKILAALRESGSDISTLSELQAEDYAIRITQVDFNADSTNELLLDIQSEVNGYHEFWVLTPDETTTLGYRRIDTPDLWFSQNCNFRSVCGGGAKILEVRDVNADGLPEWAIAIGSYCGYGECGGHLLVLGWRNAKIVLLTEKIEFWDLGWTDGNSNAILPPNGGWSFENTDEDSALELVQTMNIEDNRSCVVKDIRIFDWSQTDDAYIRASLTRDYDNSTGCALRLGHEVMKAGNYSEAIKAYENALSLFAATTNLDDYEREAQQYAQIRLMIAYALADQSENALQMREELEKQTPQSDAMGYFIDALNAYSNKNDKIALCYAVNQAVWKYDPYASSSKFYAFGSTDDVKGRPLTYVGAEFSGESSGCPVTVLLQQLALDLSLPHNQSPVSSLNKQGWKVTASVNGDLNSDNITDWLVWTEQASISPVLLILPTKRMTFLHPTLFFHHRKKRLN